MASSGTKFCLSRRKDANYVPDVGFRDWLLLRDLGLEEATNGRFRAHVTRISGPGHATGPHWHEMDFQIVYVLKGWVTFWYEGEGEVVLREGDFVFHPPRQIHDLRDYSEDVELLEIYSPARPKTVDV